MYLGDFKEDGDIFFKFTTRQFSDGVPTLLDGSPVLSVYKDEGGAATEKTTVETYFDLDVSHDSIVGWNNVRIDLAGDAYFATGADYMVVITTGTVGGDSVVGETIAHFSIENRSMGQPAGATLSDDIAAIKAETAVIEGQTDDIGVAGAGLSAVPYNSDWDADIQSECADALAVYDAPTKAEMDTAHGLLATPANVASELATYDGPTKAEMDTAHGLLATPANVASELATYDGPTKAEMDAAHALLATPAQVNAQCDSALSDYDAVIPADLTDPWGIALPGAYGAGTAGKLVGDNIDAPISVADAAIDALNDVSAADVNAQCDQALIDFAGPTKAQMDTAHALLATPAQVAAELGTYDGPTKAEMDTAHALLATPAQVAAELATYDGPTKAEMDTAHGLLSTPADILTTALTEAYAADASTATVSQLLYMILSTLSQFVITGTSISTKKLDGTTEAMVYTTDDGTNPTQRLRTA